MSAKCEGTALELALASAFRNPQGVSWKLEDRSITGARRTVNRTIHLQIRADGALPEHTLKKSLDPGCIAILCEQYPVVDYVCHSMSGELFFIQASISPYARHKTKYQHLQMRRDGGKSKSIFEEWAERAWGPMKKNQRAPYYYVYITTSPPPQRSTGKKEKDDEQLIYVGPEQLGDILKPETVRILVGEKQSRTKKAKSKKERQELAEEELVLVEDQDEDKSGEDEEEEEDGDSIDDEASDLSQRKMALSNEVHKPTLHGSCP